MSKSSTHIENFKAYFESLLSMIRELPQDRKWDVIRKSLYVAIIDSIGQIAFPKQQNANAQRFRRTILDFGKWPHATFFSLPHLHQYLKVHQDRYFKQLEIKLVKPAYAVWLDERESRRRLPWIDLPGLRQVLSLDADIPENIVLHLVKKDNLDKVKSIKRFQHYALLYSYRNVLLHSLRIPGLNDRPEEMNYPYYEEYAVTDRADGKLSIFHDLVYSTTFFYTLSERVLKNATLYFQNNEVDPYKQLQSSVALYWIDGLNQQLGGLGDKLVSMIRDH